jgi:GNAT superfamily N-acetyltransferase
MKYREIMVEASAPVIKLISADDALVTFFAYVDRAKVGHLQINMFDDKVPDARHVEKVYVDPAFRRQGIGGLLYDAAEAYLGKRGLRLVPSTRSALSRSAADLWAKRTGERPESTPFESRTVQEARETGGAALPTRQFDQLFHVGSMRAKAKSNMSYEGAGLSVSLHPTIWRRIAKGWVGGDLWRLTRAGNRFLDATALSREQHQQLNTWGQQNGYLAYADWMGGWHGTDKLWQRTGLVANHAIATSICLTLYVEDETDWDGIWWDDPLQARVGGSAPRGVILPDRLSHWTIEQVPEEAAPDKDAFKRKRK